MAKITFKELETLEPKLTELLKEARAVVGTQDGFCANFVWYSKFKPRLVRLVGWQAQRKNPELKTIVAYDVAYTTVYEALPDCRHPGPIC